MKILFINETCGRGSHGKICAEMAERMEAEGHQCKIAYGRNDVPERYKKFAYLIGSKASVYTHVLLTRLFDAHGMGSIKATKKFIEWVESFQPDMVWIHNIHGYYLNVKLLFDWLKKHPEIKKNWTLHDAWAFTGHCACFNLVGCKKWEEGCSSCVQKSEYPQSIFLDRSMANYRAKKEAFCGVNNMQLICPSQWLADLTRKSFLSEYPVEISYNTIDTNVFKYREIGRAHV